MFASIVTLLVAVLLWTTSALENGLARKPPMGWLSWTRFLCETDCVRYPDACINEKLYTDMADRLVADGYRDAGYTLVNIDDCWMAMERDAQGRLQANSTRFPHGIAWLADYMHNRSLRLGIYEDFGNFTCGGYPGSMYHLETDADTFAEWGVDMLKLDACWSEPDQMDTGYPQMTKYLNKTGRPIIFSCSWPDYIRYEGLYVNYAAVAENCNLWRNFDDISLSWASILSIIDYYDSQQSVLAAVQKPGAWNDPDMLIVGNPEITDDQARAQMSIWSIYGAPLLMSNDLRSISAESRAILLNHQVLAVNQDVLGLMGGLALCSPHKGYGVYNKPILPRGGVDGQTLSLAIAILNRNNVNINVTIYASEIGLTDSYGYDLYDLWTEQSMGTIHSTDSLQLEVNATGVAMIKATVRAATEAPQTSTTALETPAGHGKAHAILACLPTLCIILFTRLLFCGL